MSGETIGMFFLSVAIIASLIVCVLFCNNICKSEAVPGWINYNKNEEIDKNLGEF